METGTKNSLVQTAVLEALEYLSLEYGIRSDHINNAAADGIHSDDPVAALISAGRVLGMDIERMAFQPDHSGPWFYTYPALVWCEPESRFLVVEGTKGDRLSVRIAGHRRLQWLTQDSLAKRLALPVNAPGVALVPLQPRPLEPLASQPNTAKKPWQRLAGLVDLERPELAVVVIYAIGVGLLTLAIPIAIQSLFDTVAFGTVLQPLIVLSILLMGALTLSSVLTAFQRLVVEFMGRRFFVRTALDFTRRLPLVRGDESRAKLSELTNRFFEVVSVEKSLDALLFDGLSATLQIVVGLTLLGVYHPILLAFDVGLLLALSFVVFPLGRHAMSTALKESSRKYEVASWIQDQIRSPYTFKSLRGREFAYRKADGLIESWTEARSKHFKIHFRQFASVLVIQVVASVLLVLIGGLLVIEQQLTLGQLVAAEVLMTATVASLAKLGKLLSKVYDLLASLEKVGQVLDLPLEPAGGEDLTHSSRGLAVSLHSEHAQLEARPSERIAICGNDHLDKHGITEILAGLSKATTGQIRFDEVDARDLNQAVLVNTISVLREDEILPARIRENVSLGDPKVSSESVRDALRRVGIEEEVYQLSDGLDTLLDRKGRPLSEAQCALLLVARSLALAPRLVIIDRLLDTLPKRERELAMKCILDPTATWTVICISDHPDVLNRFERTVDLIEVT
jgi:putative ABC transport system ATP-binding protein